MRSLRSATPSLKYGLVHFLSPQSLLMTVVLFLVIHFLLLVNEQSVDQNLYAPVLISEAPHAASRFKERQPPVP